MTAGTGFAMGATLGVTAGFLLGFVPVMRDPALKGKRLSALSGTCVQMGSVFGVFLAVGSVIRGC
jgi:hypothetical protein